MQTVCTSHQTDNHHANASSLNFYRPDALPELPDYMIKNVEKRQKHGNVKAALAAREYGEFKKV